MRYASRPLKKSICGVLGRRKSSRTTQYAPVSSFPSALHLELFERPAYFN